MANSTSSAASSGDAVFSNWRSPIPYLFGGIALMLGLVAVALLLLVCSYRKTSTSSGGEDGKPTSRGMDDIEGAESEPKILVIMAGEKTPTYLANPISSSTSLPS
ncbi:PREDICTED: protein GLUTAMINE DUMPER 5-like [Fragaria vesca subsp. vesca]|uniref:protein GLUTAMINE DUMPER 5-like n=1 Tax=Fragaria vesca subsp. vesca TaxID=101020 RepID=UPI0002C373E7|nr:PREDICTED: protein GLUTAMINE DUMPER 5-like [Fragaria vesca subsp. vesca]